MEPDRRERALQTRICQRRTVALINMIIDDQIIVDDDDDNDNDDDNDY